MGVVIKESIKSTIVTFSGALLGAVSMLIAVKFLSKSEYGVQQSILKISSLVAYFGVFGFDYSLMVMGRTYNEDHPKRAAFLWYNLKWPFFFSILVGVAMIVVKPFVLSRYSEEELKLMSLYYYSVPILIMIFVGIYWLSGYLRSIMKTTFVFTIFEVLVRLLFLFLVFMIGLGWINFEWFLVLFVAIYLIPFLMYFLKAYKNPGFTWRVDQALEKKERNKIFEFAFYHMFAIVAGILVFQVDAILLPYFLTDGFADLAVYSVSLYAISILRMPGRVLGLNATPILTDYYNDGNHEKLKELFSRSALNLQLLTFCMSLILFVNIQNIVGIFGAWKEGYEAIGDLIPILLLGLIVEMSMGLNFEMIGISKFYRSNFWISLIFIGVIILSFTVLIKHYGQIGAAWAFSISMIVFNIIKALFVYNKLGMNALSKDTFKAIGITLVCFFINYLIPKIGSSSVDLIIRSIIILVIFTACILWLNVGEDVGHIFRKMKRRIIK